jgi:uncharacterized coiled-coil DUF342 family protein
MNIPKEYLSEKSYTGASKITIDNQLVIKFMKELAEYQKEVNPFLDKMEKISTKLKPYQEQIDQLRTKINQLVEESKPIKDEYDVQMKKVQAVDAKAQLIKNKVMPIVLDEIKDKLSEFEEAVDAKYEDGKAVVTIMDRIELAVINIRKQNETRVKK